MLNTIFGIVGWIGTLLVFAGVAIRLFRPEWDQYAYWSAVAGLVCVGLYTLTQWREIGRSFQKRETKLGAMMSISVIAVLAILDRHQLGRDAPRQAMGSHGRRVVHAVGPDDQGVEQPENSGEGACLRVSPEAFSGSATRSRMYTTRARTSRSNMLTSTASRPALASTRSWRLGTVVMEYEGRRENVMSEREQELTNNLIKVTTGRQVKAYFVQGHGERDTTGNDRPGYASVVEALKRDNYTVEKIVLAQSPAGVPADASVLILAGPTADYLKPEVDAIGAYLRKGGKALFLLDPPVGESARTTPTLEALLKEWGISLGHDVVIDISGMGQLLGTDASVPVVATYPSHPVTENFDLLTAFPLAQSVQGEAGTELGTANTQNVINTSDRSWSESDVKSLATGGKVSLDEEAGDQRARSRLRCHWRWMRPMRLPPRCRARRRTSRGKRDGAKPPPKPQMRIMVVGDSDFATNAAAGIQGNADLFVNMNNWLTQQEDLISIHPRDSGDRRVTMTADQQRPAAVVIPALHSRTHSRARASTRGGRGDKWDAAGSTLILLVVALGLGGYLYFVESERPVADENAK